MKTQDDCLNEHPTVRQFHAQKVILQAHTQLIAYVGMMRRFAASGQRSWYVTANKITADAHTTLKELQALRRSDIPASLKRVHADLLESAAAAAH